MSVFSCVTFHLLCGFTKYTIIATATLAVGLGVSQALFSPGHRHPSTDVRSKDCSCHAPAPAMGALEAAQTDPGLNQPHIHVSTKPTDTKARPASAAEARVHWVVPQSLD